MDPLQNALANGCHLRRDPRPTIERVFGTGNVDARSFVLSNTQRGPPWPPHLPGAASGGGRTSVTGPFYARRWRRRRRPHRAPPRKAERLPLTVAANTDFDGHGPLA